MAKIADGLHKCPKGLHRGYGVHADGKTIPLNMLSKWMGHASLKVAAINAKGIMSNLTLISKIAHFQAQYAVVNARNRPQTHEKRQIFPFGSL